MPPSYTAIYLHTNQGPMDNENTRNERPRRGGGASGNHTAAVDKTRHLPFPGIQLSPSIVLPWPSPATKQRTYHNPVTEPSRPVNRISIPMRPRTRGVPSETQNYSKRQKATLPPMPFPMSWTEEYMSLVSGSTTPTVTSHPLSRRINFVGVACRPALRVVGRQFKTPGLACGTVRL